MKINGIEFKEMKAIQITFSTLLWVPERHKYPYEDGNCFSVRANDWEEYKVINFCKENMDRLLKDRHIEYPIDILTYKDNALINDTRIPHHWYQFLYCECCSHNDILPLPQRLEQLRDIKRGTRVEEKRSVTIGNNYRYDEKQKKFIWIKDPKKKSSGIKGE